jgi:hypothetical protein
VVLEVVRDEVCPLRAQVHGGGEEFLLYALEALAFPSLFKGCNRFSHTDPSLLRLL